MIYAVAQKPQCVTHSVSKKKIIFINILVNDWTGTALKFNYEINPLILCAIVCLVV